MDYLAAMNMNLGWALAVEKLMKYEVSEKARHLPVLIAELGRIASHLVGMGAYGLDLGTFSPFLYAFREREKILDLFEEACGARLRLQLHHRRRPHGRPAARLAAAVRGFLDQFEPIIKEYHALLTTNAIFVKRTAGIGVIPQMAIDYRHVGPVLAAAASIRTCARRRNIYTAMYDGYAFEVAVMKDGRYPRDHECPPACRPTPVLGDCWHRFFGSHAGSRAVNGSRAAVDRSLCAVQGTDRRAAQIGRKDPGRGRLSRDGVPEGADGFLCGR